MAETDTQVKPETTPALTPAERAARLARAETLVKDHMLMSAAVGLIPAPMFDIVAAMGIQIALVKRLADVYRVPFSALAARGIVTSLLGAVTYAIGQVFIAHFELGGTLADFNVAAQRPYFKDLLQRGREVASTLTPSRAAKAPAKP
jgi:hypothetical protein